MNPGRLNRFNSITAESTTTHSVQAPLSTTPYTSAQIHVKKGNEMVNFQFFQYFVFVHWWLVMAAKMGINIGW